MHEVHFGMEWLRSPCKTCSQLCVDKDVCSPGCKPLGDLVSRMDSYLMDNPGLARTN